MKDTIRVLYVGDSSGNGQRPPERLERRFSEISVRTANAASNALDRIEDEPVDCIVSEYAMPETDGLTLLSAVRERYRGLPFIMFVEDGSERIAAEAISAGVTEYVRRESETDMGDVLAERIRSAVDGQSEIDGRDEAQRSKQVVSRRESILQAMGDGVYALDADGTITAVNETLETMTGYDRQELVGEHATAILDEDEFREGQERVGNLAAGDDRDVVKVETDVQTADGGVIRCENRITVLEGDDGFRGTVGVLRDVTERKRVEQQLREEKHKIEELHEVASVMETCTAEEEIYDLTVDAAERILAFDICGLDIAEDGYFVPKAISTGMPSDGYDRLAVDEGLAGRTYQNGRSYVVDDVHENDVAEPAQQEYRSILSVPVGEEGVFQAGSRELRAFDPEDVELAELLMSHVSEALARIRSQAALRESEEKYRTLIEQSHDAIFIYRDGEFEFLNERVYELTGYSRSEIRDMEVWDVLHPEDVDRVERIAQRRSEMDRSHYEARVETKDGDVRHLEFSVQAISYEGERANLGSARDVTERKEHERQLRALHDATRELMQAETRRAVAEIGVRAARELLGFRIAGIYLHDATRNALEPTAITEEAKELFGGAPSFEAGSSIAWHVFEQGDPDVVTNMHEREDAHNPDTEVQSELLLPLGDHGIVVAGSTTQNAFDDGDTSLAKTLATNVETAMDRAERETQLREREAEVTRQNQRLEEFAGVVSHDLRNPLNVAKGHLEMAKERDDPAHFEKTASALDRMDRLIEDLLTLARQGQVVNETRPVPLERLVEQAWRTVDTREASLVADDLGEVEADEGRLQELFENLFRNAVEHGSTSSEPSAHDAVEHGDEATTIRVGERQEGFYVEDDGPGIPPEDRDEVLKYGHTTTDDGSGLGLAIVKSITEAHGWELAVTESRDGGARFEISCE